MSASGGLGSGLYVRSGETVTGPFARTLVLQRLALGRIRSADELSHDASTWEQAEAYRAEANSLCRLDPLAGQDMIPWDPERRAAWWRWIEERAGRDRRQALRPGPFPARGPDRRISSAAGRRVLFAPTGQARRSFWVVPLGVVAVVATLTAVMGWWMPSAPIAVPDLVSPSSRPFR